MIRVKIDAEKLRGFLDCMHDEADERDRRSVAIRDIVKTAKEVGYDTKAIRKVFVRERMDEAERSKQDDLLESYEHALGGKGRALVAIAEGAPVGEAARANGVHRATVARARGGNSHVAKQPSNATPHDPETGEIETGESASAVVASLTDSPVKAGASLLPSSAPVAASEEEVLGTNELSSATGAGPFESQPTGETHGCDDVEVRVPSTGEPGQHGDGRGGRDRDAGAKILCVRDRPDGEAHHAEGEGQEVVGLTPRPDREPKPIDITIPTFLDQRRHA